MLTSRAGFRSIRSWPRGFLSDLGFARVFVLVSVVLLWGTEGRNSFVTSGLALAAQEQAQPAEGQPAAPPPENPPAQQQAAEQKPPEGQQPAPGPAPAQPPPPAQAAPPQQKPTPQPAIQIPQAEIYEVRAELFKVELTLSGKFHPEQAAEIVLRPKSWSTFRVARAVEHGTAVKKGDVLLEFEADRLTEAIIDQRRRVELAVNNLKRAEEEARYLEATLPLDLALARRAKKMSDEDWQYFLKVDKPFMEKTARFSAEVARWFLEYEQEELRQLEKMYKADELTDETEEIILRRQRNSVKLAEMDVEEADKRLNETLNFSLPRMTESRELSHQRAEHTLRYNEATLPLAVASAKLSLEEARTTLEREKKRLSELEADRELLVIRSPIDGIVYYGRIIRGTWSTGLTGSERPAPGSTVDPNKVIMTVVQPRPLSVWAEVPESRVGRLRVGLTGTAELPVLPGAYLPAKLVELLLVPVKEGTFAARIEVQIPEDAQAVVPGGSCQVRFIPYVKQRTLVVPASAVGSDELDPSKKYVWRLDPSGRLIRQQVTLGERSNERVEILDGIVAGDRILRNYSAAERLVAR
ncbi:MAG: hypothetical protein NZ899_13790 [Thermoguttaceae bacterium]|nr:hypothetical protein [Thermoguttaceae bacterium]MDW8080014.1 hypothetical protein [Thermoguttaceae bacterium]